MFFSCSGIRVNINSRLSGAVLNIHVVQGVFARSAQWNSSAHDNYDIDNSVECIPSVNGKSI